MKHRRFEWEGPVKTAAAVRVWTLESGSAVDVEAGLDQIEAEFRGADDRDALLGELTARFDATDSPPARLRVPAEELGAALAALEPQLREALEVAVENVRAVAAAQVDEEPLRVELPQGQSVTLRETPVRAAGIYAPGGRAAYPSSVIMCSVPARAAGVERIALATPPGADGRVPPVVLAAAALCEVDEVYALGGAQAIFALAYGTETIEAVDVIAGPGSPWVREAKARVSTVVGIDSLAGPSEMMVVLDGETELAPVALDLCAQAEHGEESPLVAVSPDGTALERLASEVERAASERPSVADAPLATVRVPDEEEAIGFANVFAPEHLELLTAGAAALSERAYTAGCVFAGPTSATAFGDYAAGSNHVLPTYGAGRFSGPLGPATFRRKIATVEVPPEAASKLAPYVDELARAEGFPVHGESAMIRASEEG